MKELHDIGVVHVVAVCAWLLLQKVEPCPLSITSLFRATSVYATIVLVVGSKVFLLLSWIGVRHWVSVPKLGSR